LNGRFHVLHDSSGLHNVHGVGSGLSSLSSLCLQNCADIGDFGEVLLDDVFVLFEEGLTDICEQECSTVELEEPDEEADAEVVPVGDEVENEAKEGFDDLEAAEDHPVGQPVLVVIGGIGLNGSD